MTTPAISPASTDQAPSVGIGSDALVGCLHTLHARSPIAVTNKMNFLNMYVDADFVAVTMAGQVIEYEIKVSRADFHRDRKKLRHKIYDGQQPGERPNRFWYVTANCIITADDLPAWAGWMEYENGALNVRKDAPKLSPDKHSPVVLLRLARAMRSRAPSVAVRDADTKD